MVNTVKEEWQEDELVVYLADDIGMTLGKAIAQVAHAVGAAWLARMAITAENDGQVQLSLTPAAHLAFANQQAMLPHIVPCASELLPEENLDFIEIIDAGKTLFSEPTKTCVAYSPLLGEALTPEHRLPFNDELIEYKQAFFVNRKTCAELAIADHDLIAALASASLAIILADMNDGELTLAKHSALYQWITSSFGKTVVGTKKVGKFLEVRELLATSGIRFQEVYYQEQLIGLCSEPIAADKIHQFTKYKTFNLLG